MPNWIEIRLALQGLARLVRFDSGFVRFFDNSNAGALRSFWVAAPLYPYFMLNVWLDIDPQVASETRYLLAMSVAYALSWAALPLVMLALAPVLEREGEVFRAITIYNWASLLWSALGLPLLVLGLVPLSPETLVNLDLIYLLILSVFEWFLLRHALRVRGAIAFGLVIADLVLNQFIIFPLLAGAGAAS